MPVTPFHLLGSVSYATAGFGGKLVADWVSNFASVRGIFRRDPRQDADWDATLREIDAHSYPRHALAEALVRALNENAAPPEALANARSFLQSKTVAIVTGQQAGLLGGPLFSLYKALTAVRLARSLSIRFPDRAFVPVFWVASDDHDFAEVNHTVFLTPEGKTQTLQVEAPAESMGASVGDISLHAAIERLRAPLEAVLSSTVDSFLEPYRTANMGQAFARLLTHWLGSLGLVVVESTEFRRLATRLVQRELNEFSTTSALLRESGAALQQAGYPAGLEESKTAPHLFIDAGGIRAKLDSVDADGKVFLERSSAFVTRGMTPAAHTRDFLLLKAETHPRSFSCSAALRPVLQDLTIPVAGTVLGPGELAYWAQLAPLHDHFGAVWPVIVPRASITLLDASGEKSLRKLALDPQDIFLPHSALKTKALGPAVLNPDVQVGREQILEAFERMYQHVRAADQGLDPLFRKARERITHELARIAEKTLANAAERGVAGQTRLDLLMALVHPLGKPQERMLCVGQFVARFPDIASRLLETLDPFVFEHRVYKVE